VGPLLLPPSQGGCFEKKRRLFLFAGKRLDPSLSSDRSKYGSSNTIDNPDKANPFVRGGDGKRRVFGEKMAELPKDTCPFAELGLLSFLALLFRKEERLPDVFRARESSGYSWRFNRFGYATRDETIVSCLIEVAMKSHPKFITTFFAAFFIQATIYIPPVKAEFENVGSGILNIHTQAPMQSLRMVMPLTSAGSVKPGWTTSFSGIWSNVWADNDDYSLDYEMLDSRAALTYGFDKGGGISLIYDNRGYFGGSLDSPVEIFHSVFGIADGGRDQVDKGRSRIVRIGSPDEVSEAGIFDNSGVTLAFSYDLTDGDKIFPAINLAASVRYGIDNADIFAQQHPVDYGFSLGFARRWTGKIYTHVILSHTFYDFSRTEDLSGFTSVELVGRQSGGFFAIGYEYSERLTMLAQYLYNEAAVQNISGLGVASHEVHIGLKYHSVAFGVIEFGLIENIINFDNSPDIGFHLAWSYNFF
jgi:hypothetical protein